MKNECARALASVASTLAPVLGPLGFKWRPGETGRSSGGPYANGSFVGDAISIDLIWRDGAGLGLPNYSTVGSMGDTVLAGHDSLMELLGFGKQYQFRFNRAIAVWKPYSSTGGELVEALQFDLHLIDHLLRTDPVTVRSAIASAHRNWVEQLLQGRNYES